MKYYGNIGFSEDREVNQDVWKSEITEYPYYGEVVTFGRGISSGTEMNDSLSVNAKISILADPYARKHFFNMKYIVWQGSKWKVSNVEVSYPRLVLTLGGLYVE